MSGVEASPDAVVLKIASAVPAARFATTAPGPTAEGESVAVIAAGKSVAVAVVTVAVVATDALAAAVVE
jgi:hypothetical protein